MTRLARREARTTGGATVYICGQTVSLYLAKQVYRCEECLGELSYHNAGLVCKTNPAHRGFMHQKDAQAAVSSDRQKTAQVESNYVIQDGKIVPKGANND